MKYVVALPAVVVGSLLALPLAATAAVGPAAAAPAAKPASTPAAARLASTVTLVTGDQVRLDTVNGKQRVAIEPASAKVPLTTQRVGRAVYVVPATARPYLGRLLDRNLFDVTKLVTVTAAGGRFPVRISYTGAAKPSVPGVTVTSASGGRASGYVTRSSAAAFGRALTARFEADAKAGFPARTTLFPGVTRIAAAVPGTGVATPKFPMHTLRLTATGVDGKPVQNASGFLLNVQDGRKFGGFVDFYEGEARASVPAGTYSLILDAFDFNETTRTFTDRLVTTNEYVVKGAGQTLATDFRTATLRAGQVSTPKPSTVDDYTLEWNRTDAGQNGGIDWSTGAGPDNFLFVAPSGPAKVGTLNVLQTWNASQPGATQTYAYNLAQEGDRIPATLTGSFMQADLATRTSSYYTDGPAHLAGLLRFPVYSWQFLVGGSFVPFTAPMARTEYIGANGNPLWGESYISDQTEGDDPAVWDSTRFVTRPAGKTTRTAWARGPIAPGIPVQRAADGAFCYQCRTDRLITSGLEGGLDTESDHRAEISAAEDGIPVARFRVFENSTPVLDEDDFLGGTFDVPKGKTTYGAVLDLDRRLTNQRQSTRSSTEWTFTSAAGQGKKLPSSWYCDTGDTGCRVLPVVTARVALPTTLNGRLPAGKSTVTVTASRIQAATPATIASAGLRIRVPGNSWQTVKLKKTSNGVYTGVIDNSDFAGADVDLRVTAADKSGGTFAQTVLKAYTVAAS